MLNGKELRTWLLDVLPWADSVVAHRGGIVEVRYYITPRTRITADEYGKIIHHLVSRHGWRVADYSVSRSNRLTCIIVICEPAQRYVWEQGKED